MTIHTASGALLIALTWLVGQTQALLLRQSMPDFDDNGIESSMRDSDPNNDLGAISALDPSVLLNLPFGIPPEVST